MLDNMYIECIYYLDPNNRLQYDNNNAMFLRSK